VRAARAESGLTLLELMVAVAIFAVVGSGIYSTFMTAVITRDHATQRARRYADARNALDRLEQDLRGAFDSQIRGNLVPPLLRAPLPENSPLGDDRVLLEMTTISARGVLAADAFIEHPELQELAGIAADRGEQAHVRWVVDEDGDLLRYELRPVRAEQVDWTLAPFEIIARDVAVAFEFYDRTQWFGFWDSSEPGDQRNRLPTLVRTRLETHDEGQQPVVLVSSVIVPMAVETEARRRSPFFRQRERDGRDRSGEKADEGDGDES